MRTRVKRSVVWKMPDVDFETMVKSSVSVGDICQKLSHRKGGGIFRNIRRRIDEMKLDTSHFVDGRVGKHNFAYVSKQEFLERLIRGTTMGQSFLKRKLIEFDLIKNECAECHLANVWNNKPITLHLDHIDGDYTNNTLPNFRMICPNCDTQTETYSMGTRKRKHYFCSECGVETAGYKSKCFKCGNKSRRKAIRPSKKDLEALVKSMPMTKVASHFGISDNAIRKWCESMEINHKVGRGRWTRPEDANRTRH